MKHHTRSVNAFEKQHVRPVKGKTLIVGSHVYPGRIDRRRLYKEVVGLDMIAGDGVDVVFNLEDGPAPGAPYTHADCISVLEHSKRPWLLAANLEASLVAGGSLFLTVPFIWRVHGYPSDYWRFTIAAVRELFKRIEWKRIEYTHFGTTAEGEAVPGLTHEDWKYMARTEVCGTGVLK